MTTLASAAPGSNLFEKPETRSRDQESIDIESIDSETEDQESTPSEYKIKSYPADFTLEVLHNKWKKKQIVIPSFQRRFVWKQSQSSKLIESFLLDLPVPPIFLYEESNGKLMVIDGQQRLKSIFSFFDGFFEPNEKPFKLVGLHEKSRFNNKTFKDLQEIHEESYLRLQNATLRSILIYQIDPKDTTSAYHIFERLNTGGTQLTNQEIRNAIYYGKFVDLLNELGVYPSWRKILDKPKPDSQHKDTELILRFFAMRDRSNYKKPLKVYLSKFMRENHNIAEEEIKNYREIFYRTCDKIVNYLGEKPFHLRAGVNPPALDTVMAVFSHHLNSIPDDISERYERLKQDDVFCNTTKQATTDQLSINLRFERVNSLLFEE